MTVSNTDLPVKVYSTGAATEYPIPFEYIDDSDIVVTLISATGVETSQTINDDFTIVAQTVTYSVAPGAGYQVEIRRATPYTQEVSLSSGEAPPLSTYESAFDKLTMLAQDLNEGVGRSLAVRETALAAQGFAEAARDAAISAQGLAEGARDDSITAQGLAEGARDDSITAQGLAEDARDKAALWAEEDYNVEVETGSYSAKHWAHATDLALEAVEATLVADYQRYNGFRNRLLNPGMSIDQRHAGASRTFTKGANLAYCVDRWFGYCAGADVTGGMVTLGSTPLTAYRFTGAASVSDISFGQRIESVLCSDLGGKEVTLSFTAYNSLLTSMTWAASYANTANTFGSVSSPTKTQIATGTVTLSPISARFEVTFAVPSTAAASGIEILFSVGAQISGTWTITDVQLELGTVATPVERRPYPDEFYRCQRYYQWEYSLVINGYAATTGQSMQAWVPIVPVMRATPSISNYAPDQLINCVAGNVSVYYGNGALCLACVAWTAAGSGRARVQGIKLDAEL